MSSSTKLIVVVGATGIQGSSVARTFLSLPNWHVRCITRKPSSEKAAALRSIGAEVIQADLSDLASLSQAFANATAIFLNTDFWETYRPLMASGVAPETSSQTAYDKEVSNGKNALIAAAGTPTLERLVYSALACPKAASNGKYQRSLHAESKATVVEYLKAEQPLLAKKTSLIVLGAYNSNALVRPKLDPKSGQYTVVLPASQDMRVPMVDPSETTGPLVRALIEDEEAGSKLLGVNDNSYLTVKEIMDLWSERTGKEAKYIQMSVEAINQQLGVPFEAIEMGAFLGEFGYTYGLDGIIEPTQLKNPPQTKPFSDWLREQDVKDLL